MFPTAVLLFRYPLPHLLPLPHSSYLYARLSFLLTVLSFGRCSNGFWHAINIAFQISCLRFPWLQPIFNLLMELDLASLLQHFSSTVCVMNDTIFFLHANDLQFMYTYKTPRTELSEAKAWP